eukprot:TCONS_00020725-protein
MEFDTASFKKTFNPFNLPGLYYVCQPCELTKIPQDDCGKKKRFINNKDSTPPTQPELNSPPETQRQNQFTNLPYQPIPDLPNRQIERIYPDLENIDQINLLDEDLTEIPAPDFPKETRKKTSAPDQTKDDQIEQTAPNSPKGNDNQTLLQKEKTCRFYVKGNC